MIKNLSAFLGLLTLLAATIIGMLAVTGIIGNNVSQKAPQFVEIAERVQREEVGRTVVSGDVRWTVHEARLTNVLHAYAFPPGIQTGAFVQLTFTAENISDIPVTLDAESVALAMDGLEDPADSDVNAQYVRPHLNILFNELSLIHPGESKEGKVNFDLQVPFEIESVEEVSTVTVILRDTDPTVERAEEIELRF